MVLDPKSYMGLLMPSPNGGFVGLFVLGFFFLVGVELGERKEVWKISEKLKRKTTLSLSASTSGKDPFGWGQGLLFRKALS